MAREEPAVTHAELRVFSRTEIRETIPRLCFACRKSLGIDPFPVQIDAGLKLLGRTVIEMETGEGKTLTAALPLILHARHGRAWLATANDYLALRDARLLEPVFNQFGLTVGCITADLPPTQRREQYRRDVVYGTLREFGFDYLRDRLLEAHDLTRSSQDRHVTQILPNYVLVDEADSLLIDEATTPLIVSGQSETSAPAESIRYSWAAQLAEVLEPDRHFILDSRSNTFRLTHDGRRVVIDASLPADLVNLTISDLFEALELAIRCRETLQCDVHYVVRQGRVQIVDEGTGRVGENRRWQAGLHQAVEARERVTITLPTRSLARITLQELVRRFPQCAGMTGTAVECRRELRGVYGLAVRRIPTRLPSRRQELPPIVCPSWDEKLSRVVSEVRKVRDSGRATLVGTRSILASRILCEGLNDAGIDCSLLNALHPEREAEIIAEAGQAGRVTVATNMAGRGTDIRLEDGVRDRGGLHVIGTELHTSSRIDRQLAGRCGRQGDPGTFRQYVSGDDSLFKLSLEGGIAPAFSRSSNIAEFRNWQRRIEARDQQARLQLMLNEADRREWYSILGMDPVVDLLEE